MGEMIADAYELCLGTSRTDCNRKGNENEDRLEALCLGTSRTDCNPQSAAPDTFPCSLPRHIPHGLQLVPKQMKPPTRNFASAHPARIATTMRVFRYFTFRLCLGTSRTDCNFLPGQRLEPAGALPRHIPHGLQPQKCTGCNARFCGMCRESVDSFLQH